MNQLYLDLCKTKALAIDGGGLVKTVYYDVPTGCCCITGYVFKACTGKAMFIQQDPRADACFKALAEAGNIHSSRPHFDHYGLIPWNDAPERTFQEVIDLIDRAAQRASQ